MAAPVEKRRNSAAALNAEINRQLGAADGGAARRVKRPDVKPLPPGAPVKPLGVQGKKIWFLDGHGQVVDYASERFARSSILHLFGSHTDWLYSLWPKWKKIGDEFVRDDWNATHAQEALFEACAARGLWSPTNHVRGRGAWRLDDGSLALHCGREIYLSRGGLIRPGVIDGQIYPADEQVTAPATGSAEISGASAAAELLATLESWRWSRPHNPRLLLGWAGAAMIAGALKVRPLVWVTGEKGTGKSSLTGEGGILDAIFGDSLLTTANTTAAGLYQKIRFDALPVAVDEIEAKRGNQKTEAVIELARQAFSGGMVLRGGQDHNGQEFRARCPILFSSILIPPLPPQDLSRLAVLGLEPFEPGAAEPPMDRPHLAAMGRAMLRRMLEKWADWDERFGAWRGYLLSLGHNGRAADQFGTLLAAADLLLTDGAPDTDSMETIAGDMAPDQLAETQAEASNASRCINFAMSRLIDKYKSGELMTAGEWVAAAVGRLHELANPPAPREAQRVLARSGILVGVASREDGEISIKRIDLVSESRVDALLDTGGGGGWIVVCFCSQGEGVLELFRGSDWEGAAGAHNPFTQALERLPGVVLPTKNLRIGKQSGRVAAVPIGECVDLGKD